MFKRIGDVNIHANEGENGALRCISIGASTNGERLRFVSVDVFFSPEEAREVAQTMIEFADRIDAQLASQRENNDDPRWQSVDLADPDAALDRVRP